MPSVAYSQTAFEAIQQNREVSSRALEEAAAESTRTGQPTLKVADKYFVLKSLTVEDMELSVRNSIWATQSHNEDTLNKAYEVSNNASHRCAQLQLTNRVDIGKCIPYLLSKQVWRIFRRGAHGFSHHG